MTAAFKYFMDHISGCEYHHCTKKMVSWCLIAKQYLLSSKLFMVKWEKKADVTHLWDFNRPSPPSCHVRQTEVWWWSGREMPRNVSRTVSLQQSASRLETGPILSRSRLSDSETPLNGSTLRPAAYSCSAIARHRKTPKSSSLNPWPVNQYDHHAFHKS